jgi:hypothetical protein
LLDRDRDPELNRIKTQFADMRKVGNTHTPGTQDRTGGRVDVRGAKGNLRLETVQMSGNHALDKNSDENSEGRTGMGTPKRKLDNQEGELFFIPAKRMNLNMHSEVDFETWTHEQKSKPSDEIFENIHNEGFGTTTSHATPRGKPQNK